jgi:Dynamin family
MKRQIEYPKLLIALKKVQSLALRIQLEKDLREIKDLDIRGFDDLIRECRRFQDNVERATEDCRAAVESPIYIGVVGHFSHGKSSLLNALLFPQKYGELLPTGEGVVTSMCTLVQFSNQADQHEFYSVREDGEESFVPDDEYQAFVSGKRGQLNSTSHFKIRLQVEKLSDRLFHTFAEKQIEMLDTPGLGGPFWNEQARLLSWIKEFVMIVVCIKASEINEITADTVNPFLRLTTKPIIPVITFWDQWQDSTTFKGIVEESKARAEAKRQISKYFPTLEQFVDQTIFTSSRACMDARPVPEGIKRDFTDEWNVDNIRRIMATHVQTKGDILRREKDKESNLDSQRRAQVRQLTEKLCKESEHYSLSLRTKITAALPPPDSQVELILDQLKEDLNKEVERETARIASQVDRVFGRQISLISNAANWGKESSKVKQEAENQYLDTKRQSVERIISAFERLKQLNLDSISREKGLREVERKRLDQNIKKYLQEFRQAANDVSHPPEIIIIPNVVLNAAANFFQAIIGGFKQLIVTNMPLALFLLGFGVLLTSFPFILKFLNFLPGVSIIVPLAWAVFACVLFGIFYSQFQQAIKLSLVQAVNKTLELNHNAQISDRISTDFGRYVGPFYENLSKALEVLRPLDEKTKDVLERMNGDLEQLDDSIVELRQII